MENDRGDGDDGRLRRWTWFCCSIFILVESTNGEISQFNATFRLYFDLVGIRSIGLLRKWMNNPQCLLIDLHELNISASLNSHLHAVERRHIGDVVNVCREFIYWIIQDNGKGSERAWRLLLLLLLLYGSLYLRKLGLGVFWYILCPHKAHTHTHAASGAWVCPFDAPKAIHSTLGFESCIFHIW